MRKLKPMSKFEAIPGGAGKNSVYRMKGFSEASAQETKSLSDRYLVPPFSILNAREGGWQDRKREWLALGIESELGRGAVTYHIDRADYPNASPGGSPRPAMDYRHNERGDGRGKPIEQGAGLNFSNDWVRRKIAEGDLKGGLSSGQSGTSIFDPFLCELMYRWFCPVTGKILDPFAGGSVRGVVAAKLGRSYVGIDLRPEQIEANEAQRAAIVPNGDLRWFVGDSRHCGTLAPDRYDFVFSCPPYGDLEVYSDNPADLSTMAHSAFVEAYNAIIAKSCKMLKPDRFACFVVGDFRDKKGNYRNFVSDTIAAFRLAGLELYNEAILLTAVGSLPIRAAKQFETSRKLGKTHQNVLIFLKGDAREATKAIGPVNGEIESMRRLAKPNQVALFS